jgi:pyruvate dehydrogenase E1 component alpha subunit
MECRTYRYYGHTVFDNPLTYRTKEEEAYWHSRDPLKLFRERVEPEGLLSAAELDRIDREVDRMMDEAIKFADDSPLPDPSQLYEDVYVSYPRELLKRGTNMEV